VLLMAIYSVLTGAFFALLWKDDRRERWRLFAKVAAPLFLAGVALAWIMFPFPLR
jgi:uncharacterized membrane protein